MKTNITAAHAELTDLVRERIEKICARLEKLANVRDVTTLQCNVEIQKTTEHHRKGILFRAEIDFSRAGEHFRAVAEAETVIQALDVAHDEIKREFVQWKQKRQSRVRRGGLQGKQAAKKLDTK